MFISIDVSRKRLNSKLQYTALTRHAYDNLFLTVQYQSIFNVLQNNYGTNQINIVVYTVFIIKTL